MHRISLPDGDAWRCARCGFSALGEPQESTVKLALEIVPAEDDTAVSVASEHDDFRQPVRVVVRPLAKARRAVKSAGGVLAVLQQWAGIDVSVAVAGCADFVAFELEQVPILRAKLRAQRLLDVCGSDIPGWVEASFAGEVAQETRETAEAAMRRMPATLRHSLMPFQEEGVRFGLQRHGRCLIGDEMGVSPQH